jgi:hypothetical protein
MIGGYFDGKRWFQTVDCLPNLAIGVRGDNRGVAVLHQDKFHIDSNYFQGTLGEQNV